MIEGMNGPYWEEPLKNELGGKRWERDLRVTDEGIVSMADTWSCDMAIARAVKLREILCSDRKQEGFVKVQQQKDDSAKITLPQSLVERLVGQGSDSILYRHPMCGGHRTIGARVDAELATQVAQVSHQGLVESARERKRA